ncbi:DUF397 domain-containing protein [Actinomadura syzygii]|uniref:DUF397 domain-containing protein n=1 Tax=Actinomadura syzygii TaxID=1427538 RepID=A0A5D0U817_9ACTN|nr:DUF397 domain-containing protein [Actinomadura syzygii]TYC13856.1 DUF397 domain-containing protein [Actinomadura syzygii]
MFESDDWPETNFRCNGGGGCVIVEKIAGAVVIRDSKNPYQPGLVFSRKEYAQFRRRVRGGASARVLLTAGADITVRLLVEPVARFVRWLTN